MGIGKSLETRIESSGKSHIKAVFIFGGKRISRFFVRKKLELLIIDGLKGRTQARVKRPSPPLFHTNVKHKKILTPHRRPDGIHFCRGLYYLRRATIACHKLNVYILNIIRHALVFTYVRSNVGTVAYRLLNYALIEDTQRKNICFLFNSKFLFKKSPPSKPVILCMV